MVMEFGMSDLGPINLAAEQRSYMGRAYAEPQQLSNEMMARVDAEVKKLIEEGHKLAAGILKKNRKLLDKIVKVLLEKETIEGEEFEELMGHTKVTK